MINPDVIMDPSLPRTRDFKCPKCGHDEAVFFNAQSTKEDEAMSLMFLCCKAGCKKYWKSIRGAEAMSPSPVLRR